jgi:hypothetical protein
MISKSTKTKRRRNAAFYKMVADIKIVLSTHEGEKVYLMSRETSNGHRVVTHVDGESLIPLHRLWLETIRTLVRRESNPHFNFVIQGDS